MALLLSRQLYFIFTLLVFRMLLDYSYINIISQRLDAARFTTDFDTLQYLLSWVFYAISLMVSSNKLKQVSDYFFILALLAVIAPLTSLFGLDSKRSFYVPCLFILAFLFMRYLVSLHMINFKNTPKIKGGLGIGVVLSLLFVLFLAFWFSISGAQINLNLAKVYEFRTKNADIVANGILAYTNSWTYQIFNIFLISVSLLYKRFVFFFIFCIVQVYFFSVTAHKSVLLFPVVIFGTWIYFRKYNHLIGMSIFFSVVVLSAILSYGLFDDLWFPSMFVRRLFYVPADLSFVYFEFFSNNPKVYWSNSILSAIFEYPYELSISRVIGGSIGFAGMNANNGFISSGFAHAGVIGVIIYSVIISVLLNMIDDLSNGNMPIWFAVAICVVPMRSFLISSDLFTVLLTHGFFVAIFLIYLSRKTNVKYY